MLPMTVGYWVLDTKRSNRAGTPGCRKRRRIHPGTDGRNIISTDKKVIWTSDNFRNPDGKVLLGEARFLPVPKAVLSFPRE